MPYQYGTWVFFDTGFVFRHCPGYQPDQSPERKNADGALCVLLGVIVLAAVAAVLVFEIRHIIRSGENIMGRLRYSIAYISGTAVCLIHCFVCRLI